MERLKIKICGMKHAANIAAVAELKPDYLGFIFYQKSPRFISEISSELIKYVPSTIKTTGVFVDESEELVKAYVIKYNLKAIQLHAGETADYCRALKQTGAEVIKAFGVDENFDFSRLAPYQDAVDYFLFDTQTAQHGGSGKPFDWHLLKNYPFETPYFLSGGITLDHVEMIKKINDDRLHAVDLNSRFELEPGLKDVDKLNKFIQDLAI